MAEKILNTRIQLKYDSYTNWQTENPTLKSGELAIAYLGDTHTTTTPDNGTHPVLFKVGPGKFNDLPWASALAADVYAWAKLTEAQFVDGFLAMKATDGSTIQSKLDGVFATDVALAQAITDVREEITNLSVSALEARVKAIEDDYLKAVDIANMATEAEVEAAVKTETDRALAAEAALGQRIDAIDFVDETELANALKPYAKSADVAATYETIANVDLVRNRVTTLENAGYATTTQVATAKEEAITAAAQDAASKYATVDAAEAAQNTANAAKKRIDTFLDSEDISGAVDTLVELNKYITDDTEAFTGLSERVTKLENGTTPAAKATHAETASGLDATGEAQVKGIKVDEASYADSADNATNLGGKAAADYVLKSEASGYGDILTKTIATSTYEPIGAEDRAKTYADGLAKNYATAAQGAKADSALQGIEAGTGLKVSAKADNKQTIDIDESVTFIFNCGDSKTLID